MTRILRPPFASHRDRRIQRRTLLQACGMAAGALAVPVAHSADVEPPRRVIFLIGAQGWVRRNWAMKPPGSDPSLSEFADTWDPEHEIYSKDDDEWEFDLTGLTQDEFSVGLKPLWPFRKHLLCLDGLSLQWVTSQNQFGDAHAAGHLAATTGYIAARSGGGPKALAGAPSVDQLIKAHLRAQDPGLTDLTSLEYTLSSAFPFHHMIYAGRENGDPIKVPAERDVANAMARLFPSVEQATALSSEVQLVASRYDALQAKLSGEDQAKMVLHRDLLNDVQKRLDVLSMTACTQPEGYEAPDGATSYEKYRGNFSAFARLMTTAMSCGLTRVGTIQVHSPSAEGLGGSGDVHHDYAHPSSPSNEFDTAKADKFWNGIDKMTNQMVIHAEMAAELAGLLDAVPEGNGTMLDHTAIVMINELSHGGHGHDQYPVNIIGGFGGAVTPGRFVRWPRNKPNPTNRNYSRQYFGHPHTQLLISICQAMGMEIDSLGLDRVEGVLKKGSDRPPAEMIDLTGPLARLKV